jgi:hypothetical protein
MGIIGLMATLHQSTRFVDRVYTPLEVEWEGELVTVCQFTWANWVTYINLDVYFLFYFGFRVIFVHVVPCVLLVVLNVLLCRAMREAQRRRETLLLQNRRNECRRLRDSNYTTFMLIIVVSVFLGVEIPLAVITVLHMISSSVTEILDYDIANALVLFSNFFIVASYSINFGIYCGMSQEFRDTFKKLFKRRTVTARTNGGNSRSSHVNGRRTSTSETVL